MTKHERVRLNIISIVSWALLFALALTDWLNILGG